MLAAVLVAVALQAPAQVVPSTTTTVPSPSTTAPPPAGVQVVQLDGFDQDSWAVLGVFVMVSCGVVTGSALVRRGGA